MADLLIRNIEPQLKREIERRARANRRSLPEEAKALLRQALSGQAGRRTALLHQALSKPTGQRKLGTELMNLLPPDYRSDDYVFEIRGEMSRPPDFD